jgi:anti-anti-sigma factor
VGEVVVDLEHATYIDSAGLGVLVSAHDRLMARRGNLVICSPTPRSMKSLETAGLSSS